MISITEIVLIIAGFAAIILGYLLPAGKEMDEEDKALMEKEIRELVKREVEEQKDTIDDMVDDSLENSLDRTERAMERISNEKLSAIGEYSDTVINDIHKNHNEVMFMYDMLNDKHKNLTSVVTEVTRKADEAKQVVRDAEVTAKEAHEASTSFKNSSVENNVRAILLDDNDDRPSGIRIPYKEKSNKNPNVITPQTHPGQQFTRQDDFGQQLRGEVAREPLASNIRPTETEQKSGYVEENKIKKLEELESIPAEVLSSNQVENSHIIGSTSVADPSKVVPITEAVRVESKPHNPDTSMKELTANDPISQNKQIIEMHKAGKSNMVIARELGLGIGEVKLVIDLSNKHRKVR